MHDNLTLHKDILIRIKGIITFLFILMCLPVTRISQIYLDSTATVEERVQDLLGRMILDEKIGQMVQTERGFSGVNALISDHFLGSVLSGGGSVPGSNTLQDWVNMYNGMQDAALSTLSLSDFPQNTLSLHGFCCLKEDRSQKSED
jgi:hypothetical protein